MCDFQTASYGLYAMRLVSFFLVLALLSCVVFSNENINIKEVRSPELKSQEIITDALTGKKIKAIKFFQVRFGFSNRACAGSIQDRWLTITAYEELSDNHILFYVQGNQPETLFVLYMGEVSSLSPRLYAFLANYRQNQLLRTICHIQLIKANNGNLAQNFETTVTGGRSVLIYHEGSSSSDPRFRAQFLGDEPEESPALPNLGRTVGAASSAGRQGVNNETSPETIRSLLTTDLNGVFGPDQEEDAAVSIPTIITGSVPEFPDRLLSDSTTSTDEEIKNRIDAVESDLLSRGLSVADTENILETYNHIVRDLTLNFEDVLDMILPYCESLNVGAECGDSLSD